MPKDILPICRWRLGDILDIAARLSNGETPYAIAKRIGESVASLRRLKSWLAEALDVIVVLARELGLLDREPALELANRWPTWASFNHAFSRTLYPKRFPLLTSHTILTG